MESSPGGKILNQFRGCYEDGVIYQEVYQTIGDMIWSVENWNYQCQLVDRQNEIAQLKKTILGKNKRAEVLQKEKESIEKKYSELHQRAISTRQLFVTDIGQLLSEGRQIVNLKTRIVDLSNRIKNTESLEVDLLESKKKIKELEKNLRLSKVDESQIIRNAFVYLDDKCLLFIFSFLKTADVLAAAQVCRYVFKRVDALFGINSQIVKDAWGEPPPPVRFPAGQKKALSLNKANQVEVFSKKMVEDLSKKLTAIELKTIVSMTERLKNFKTQIDSLTLENEDLKNRLQTTENMRDFLVTKLKDAEIAIKDSMTDLMQKNRQSENDHEIISHLDNRVAEMEVSNAELKKKCEYFQASLELLRGTNLITEQQLTVQLNELREKLEIGESTFKAQKKTLVKEVKSLRAENRQITDERDRLRNQLDNLRKALGS